MVNMHVEFSMIFMSGVVRLLHGGWMDGWMDKGVIMFVDIYGRSDSSMVYVLDHCTVLSRRLLVILDDVMRMTVMSGKSHVKLSVFVVTLELS